MAYITSVPSVGVIPAPGLANRIDPVMKPRSVGNGVNRAVFVNKPPGVLDGDFQSVLRQGRLPLKAIGTLLMDRGQGNVVLCGVARRIRTAGGASVSL